jgi:hypothetical protein
VVVDSVSDVQAPTGRMLSTLAMGLTAARTDVAA